MNLDLPEAAYGGVLYEYAVLVTSLQDEVRQVAQHYRDRGDSENNFDELKTVGMGRLHHARPEAVPSDVAHDRSDLQLVDGLHAAGNSGQACQREAITSRPLALHGIARQTRHSNQTTVEVTSTHPKAGL